MNTDQSDIAADLRNPPGNRAARAQWRGIYYIFDKRTSTGKGTWAPRTGRTICGDIPPDFPVAVRAIQVTDFARALSMRAQIGAPRNTLLKEAEEAAHLVLLPSGIHARRADAACGS